jgi:hypothetical protein
MLIQSGGQLNWSTTNTLAIGAGGLTIDNGATWNNAGNGAITISGSITNNGSFTSGTATYTLNGGAAQTIAGSSLTFTSVTLAAGSDYTNNTTSYLEVTTSLLSTGTLIQGTNSLFKFGGTSIAATLSCLANTPNTVEYNAGGAIIQTVKGDEYCRCNCICFTF